jgi:hypothetical protein
LYGLKQAPCQWFQKIDKFWRKTKWINFHVTMIYIIFVKMASMWF